MRHGIAIANQVPELKKLFEELDEHGEQDRQKIMFIKKQVEDGREAYRKKHREIWDRIENVLKEKGLLSKAYSLERDGPIAYDEGTSLVYTDDEANKKQMGKEALMHLLGHILN